MNHFTEVAAYAVAIVSVARTLRLLIYDDFPPVAWLRVRLIAALGDSWGKLLTCQFCLAPYAVVGMGLWMWLSDLNTVWWVVNGGWAAAYVAAIVVSYDQPE